MVSGSDRACEHWRENYRIDGVDELDLHHLYRAMSWLGEELPESEKRDRTLVPRCIKDLVEEQLFERPRCARAKYQGGRSPSASRCRPTSVKPTRSRRPEMRLDPTSVVLRTPRTRVTAWRHTFFSSMVLKLGLTQLLDSVLRSLVMLSRFLGRPLERGLEGRRRARAGMGRCVPQPLVSRGIRRRLACPWHRLLSAHALRGEAFMTALHFTKCARPSATSSSSMTSTSP